MFFNANILKIMMTWKIVRVSKVSVLYIYIDYIFLSMSFNNSFLFIYLFILKVFYLFDFGGLELGVKEDITS